MADVVETHATLFGSVAAETAAYMDGLTQLRASDIGPLPRASEDCERHFSSMSKADDFEKYALFEPGCSAIMGFMDGAVSAIRFGQSNTSGYLGEFSSSLLGLKNMIYLRELDKKFVAFHEGDEDPIGMLGIFER
jgi:hypothetical protein